MGIRVTYNPVGAMGLGALSAGYGQYEQKERARIEEQNQRWNIEQARIAADAQRQAAQITSQERSETNRTKLTIAQNKQDRIDRMGLQDDQQAFQTERDKVLHQNQLGELERRRTENELEFSNKQKKEIERIDNSIAEVQKGAYTPEVKAQWIEDLQREKDGLKPIQRKQPDRPMEITEHKTGGFFWTDTDGSRKYQPPEPAAKTAKDDSYKQAVDYSKLVSDFKSDLMKMRKKDRDSVESPVYTEQEAQAVAEKTFKNILPKGMSRGSEEAARAGMIAEQEAIDRGVKDPVELVRIRDEAAAGMRTMEMRPEDAPTAEDSQPRTHDPNAPAPDPVMMAAEQIKNDPILSTLPPQQSIPLHRESTKLLGQLKAAKAAGQDISQIKAALQALREQIVMAQQPAVKPPAPPPIVSRYPAKDTSSFLAPKNTITVRGKTLAKER